MPESIGMEEMEPVETKKAVDDRTFADSHDTAGRVAKGVLDKIDATTAQRAKLTGDVQLNQALTREEAKEKGKKASVPESQLAA